MSSEDIASVRLYLTRSYCLTIHRSLGLYILWGDEPSHSTVTQAWNTSLPLSSTLVDLPLCHSASRQIPWKGSRLKCRLDNLSLLQVPVAQCSSKLCTTTSLTLSHCLSLIHAVGALWKRQAGANSCFAAARQEGSCFAAMTRIASWFSKA